MMPLSFDGRKMIVSLTDLRNAKGISYGKDKRS